jgi:agmatine deiminase
MGLSQEQEAVHIQEAGGLKVSESSTARQNRYLMPAEWEKHEATWLSWPKDPLTFPPEILGKVEETYIEMTRALSRGERVKILVDDDAMLKRVSLMVGDSPQVSYLKIKTADVWIRDYGPIFVRRGDGLAAVKWRFNAWGGKYDELKPDDRAGLEVANASGFPVVEPGIVLEGGSIDTNGRGTCLTTKQCLLNKNRNPGLTQEQIEAVLRGYLGFTNFIWLGRGIAGDDTDGHVDDIVRFVDPDTVVCMVEDDLSDKNRPALTENLRVLMEARDEEGDRLRVIPVAMPKKKSGGDEPLPASYANFYIGNSVVLVPTFDDENDAAALSRIKTVFPGRDVIGINCEALVYGFGGLHCVTQQQPSTSGASDVSSSFRHAEFGAVEAR